MRLGNPNGAAALGGLARAVRRSGRPSRATPIGMPGTWRRWSRTSAAAGATSLRAIAAELNARGMLTRRGGRWHVSTVMNLLDRLGEAAMRQSRLMSLVEAVTNVVVGYGVAVVTQMLVFPIFGLATTSPTNLGLARSSPACRSSGAMRPAGCSTLSAGVLADHQPRSASGVRQPLPGRDPPFA